MPGYRTAAAIAGRADGAAARAQEAHARGVRALRADPCAPRAQPSLAGGAPRPGQGVLEVARVRGESAVLACASRAPLRLLAPRPRGRASWVVAATYGGGLVAGDDVALEVEVGEGATLCLGTQAETKVYRSSGAEATQSVVARVAADAALFVLPDPVSLFAGARYRQEQRFALAEGASLALVDALVAGRTARGERWAFAALATRTTVEVAGRLVLADALRLSAGEAPAPPERLRDAGLLATVLLLGPAVRAQAERLLAETAAAPATRGAEVLVAASPLAGGALLRLAARSVEAGLAALRARLAFVSLALDGNPLLRRP